MFTLLAPRFLLLLFSVVTTSWTQGALALNVLVSTPNGGPLSSWNITANQYLNVSNIYLVMQPDCNLVTYNGSTPFLTSGFNLVGPSGPSSTWNCYATLQFDGNFVVYQRLNATAKTPLWSSFTNSLAINASSDNYMVLGGDGSLRMYQPDGSMLNMQPFVRVNTSSFAQNATANVTYPFPPGLEWKPTSPLDGYPYLPAGYFLTQGSMLKTGDGTFVLILGHDCKLQSQKMWLENNTVKGVIWEPQAAMPAVVSGICEMTLQQDGVLEVRDNKSAVVYWNSSVSGGDSVDWVLNLDANDGHVSVSDILDPSNILWASTEEERLKPQNEMVIWRIVVGVVCGVLVVAMAGLWFWYFYVRPRFLNPADEAFQKRLRSIGGRAQLLSEAKIKQATNNFEHRIGYGGFSDVFYGKLEDGQEIAAKVLSSGSHQSKEDFYNEIELLSMVHHKYLVTLIGYSFTPQHQILIYEFMSGGDLRHRLSQGRGSAGDECSGDVAAGIRVAERHLTWKQRISITLQVAEGIEYLHDKSTPGIIHRDIKSNNILLTNDLVAKVADFGLSKLRRIDQQNATHITTIVKGTPGYLDPEYHKTGLLTEKSDVYAFGIVLMEILTGQQQMLIAEKVFEARKSGKLEALVDASFKGDYDKEEFVNLVDLSLWCVRKNNGNRPFMRQVVQRLREIAVAPLESSALPKVIDCKPDHNHVIGLENSEEVINNETVPFSGFSSGAIKSGSLRHGDNSFSRILDHSSSQSSAGSTKVMTVEDDS